MFSLVRSVVLRSPLAVVRSHAPAGLQRLPHLSNITSYRAFSNTPFIFAAATTKKKPIASKTKTAGRSKPKTKAKPKAKVKAKPKAKAKAKAKVKAKPKKTAPKPQTRFVPLAMRPPKKPPTAFFIFYKRTFPMQKDVAIAEMSKAAGTAWGNLTEAEKKPFHDERQVLQDKYAIAREKWFKDPKNEDVLKALNKARVKRGKPRLRSLSGTQKRPMTSFLRFAQSLRSSNDPSLSLDNAPPGTSHLSPQVWFARETGARWRALPASEKEKYAKEYEADMAKWMNLSKTASPSARA